MPNIIKYSPGQEVGPHGVKYLNDVEPRVQPNGQKRRMARFLCKCGKDFHASISKVKGGDTQSCGCFRLSLASGRLKHKTGEDHPNWKGGVRSEINYGRWYNMCARCHRSAHQSYADYGARGISVCQEWRDDYWAFANYVEALPNYDKVESEGWSLDRIDNDGNYEPGNVKWSSRSEQNLNQRPKISNTEHDRIVAEKDAIIAEQDALIAELQEKLARKYWD